MKFGIQAAAFSPAIHVGTLSSKGDSFASKEDLTDMALFAVAKYVEQNFDGGMTMTFPRVGLKMTVKVEPMDDEVWGKKSNE